MVIASSVSTGSGDAPIATRVASSARYSKNHRPIEVLTAWSHWEPNTRRISSRSATSRAPSPERGR